jgi:hypothetical protein
MTGDANGNLMTLEIATRMTESALERAARRRWGPKVEHFAEERLIRMFDWAQEKYSERLRRARKERARPEVGTKDTRQEAACPNLVNGPLTGVRLGCRPHSLAMHVADCAKFLQCLAHSPLLNKP